MLTVRLRSNGSDRIVANKKTNKRNPSGSTFSRQMPHSVHQYDEHLEITLKANFIATCNTFFDMKSLLSKRNLLGVCCIFKRTLISAICIIETLIVSTVHYNHDLSQTGRVNPVYLAETTQNMLSGLFGLVSVRLHCKARQNDSGEIQYTLGSTCWQNHAQQWSSGNRTYAAG